MYHEVTLQDEKRKRRHITIVVITLLVICTLSLFGLRMMRSAAREQGAVALRSAILDAALRCCAIEGSYPLSLSHLEEGYGLRINHKDFIITYEAYASNMVPSVVVVPR